jgi:hypothetical protein
MPSFFLFCVYDKLIWHWIFFFAVCSLKYMASICVVTYFDAWGRENESPLWLLLTPIFKSFQFKFNNFCFLPSFFLMLQLMAVATKIMIDLLKNRGDMKRFIITHAFVVSKLWIHNHSIIVVVNFAQCISLKLLL